jgi:hypothetical protein
LVALDGFTVTAAGTPSNGDHFDIVQPCSVLHSQTAASSSIHPESVVQVLNIGSIGTTYELPGYDEQPNGFIKLRNLKITTDGNQESIGLFVANAWVRLWNVQIIGAPGSAHPATQIASGGLDFLRSYCTVGSGASACIHFDDGRFQSNVESSFVTVIAGTAPGILSEASNHIFVQGSYVTTAGSGPAIQGIGPGYMRLIGNNYVTSASGAGVQAQRGSQIRIGGVLANATGNNGTWGVRCSQTGAVFISSSTTTTGTTGDATNDGTNTTAYSTIRGNSPPTIFSTTEGCYVGQE